MQILFTTWMGNIPYNIYHSTEVTLRWVGPVSTWMGDCLRAGKPSWHEASQLGRLSLLPSVGL